MIKTVTIAPVHDETPGLHRSYDTAAFIRILELYPEVCGDPEEAWGWVNQHRNVLLREGDNFGMFDFFYPKVFTGHYLFNQARGRDALRLAKTMLNEMFVNYGAQLIRGLTPLENRKAAWMTRQLGFKSHGLLDFPAGRCELFCLTIDEFFGARNG